MKTFLIALIGLGLCAQGNATSISTTDGVTYNNVTSQRVDPDGLFIQYTLPDGGIGMSKVKFSRLSSDQQKQFGFDAAKARDYETQTAKANEDFRQQCVHMEQVAQTQKTDEQSRADQEQRLENEHLMALAQLKTAEADLARANNGANAGYGWSGGADGLFAVPGLSPNVRPRTQFDSIVTPIPFPQLNTPHYSRR
jgi:hypothetical protein